MLDKIKNIAIWISVVLATISSLYGAYSFFTKKIIAEDRKTQHELALEQKVEKWIKIDSLKTIQTDQIADTLSLIVKNQAITSRQVKKISIGLTNHFKQTDRMDELLNFIMN
jgi:hypothetical protein